MSSNTENLVKHLQSELKKASSASEISEIRRKYVGKKSELQSRFKALGRVQTLETKKSTGEELNKLKQAITQLIDAAELDLQGSSDAPFIDVSKPGNSGLIGHYHPVMSTLNDLVQYFTTMGFDIAQGPEMETDWYCFEALNIPKGHPARDMQDTFYLENGLIPRTHTSSVQIRHMEKNKPPIRIISPGKVFRNEDEDSTHAWSFYQLEGLVIGEDINLGHLKGTLLGMVKHILGPDTQIRLRPNYFPYVEPALEVDAGRKNSITGEVEWLELLGAGMVHEKVLENVKIDPNVYQGFAFGVGIERLAAIKHNVHDIRKFWRPDFNFLEQF